MVFRILATVGRMRLLQTQSMEGAKSAGGEGLLHCPKAGPAGAMRSARAPHRARGRRRLRSEMQRIGTSQWSHLVIQDRAALWRGDVLTRRFQVWDAPAC